MRGGSLKSEFGKRKKKSQIWDRRKRFGGIDFIGRLLRPKKKIKRRLRGGGYGIFPVEADPRFSPLVGTELGRSLPSHGRQWLVPLSVIMKSLEDNVSLAPDWNDLLREG